MSLAENLSIIDMKYDDPKNMDERMVKLIEQKPKLVTIDYLNLLPNPPANNSPEIKRELMQLKKKREQLQKNKSLQNFIKIIDVDADFPMKKIAEKYGLEYPQKLADKLWRDVLSPIQMQLKWKFNRPRPYQLAKKLGIDLDHIETKTHHTPSYPSGHAVHGYFTAFLLSDLYPKHEDEWMQAGKEVAMARMYQGVHFQSDTDAAFYIAKKIWNDIKDKYKNILT
jgi:acid phosphatase (class A)